MARPKQAKGLVRAVTPTRGNRRLDLIPDRMHPSLPGPEGELPAFVLVRGHYWWAWEDLNLRPHPQVKIPGRGGKLPGTYKADADLASSAEQSTARGPVVLPIFIRQGWPQAMSHLSGIEGSALCGPPFSQVAGER
jgi:hypothetical protein